MRKVLEGRTLSESFVDVPDTGSASPKAPAFQGIRDLTPSQRDDSLQYGKFTQGYLLAASSAKVADVGNKGSGNSSWKKIWCAVRKGKMLGKCLDSVGDILKSLLNLPDVRTRQQEPTLRSYHCN